MIGFKNAVRNLLHFSTSSEVLLLLATMSALLIVNSGFSNFYHEFFSYNINLKLENLNINEKFSLKFFIDDFLMAIFFLLIGLELKREMLVGELSSRSKILLPLIAAIGGVIMPALIFSYFNVNNEDDLRGFAIPCATDIAFAYAVVKAFGNKISNSTKVFIISLAVIDDLIAIFIIAFFYTKEVHAFYLLYSFATMFLLALMGLKKVEYLWPYLILGLILWFLVLKSGIHPSVAGIVLAMFIPFKTANYFLFERMAKKLVPLVNFIILPLFAFANAGLEINNLSLDLLRDSLIIGVVVGLFLGKQLGIMLFSFIAIKLKICSLPKDANWLEFYGVAILAGIGFTMSLFIGNLAFNETELLDKVKLAVLFGSTISFIFGVIILLLTKSRES